MDPMGISRWWFQIFFIFTPIWGRFPFWLYNIFQMGWNHQLGICFFFWIFWSPIFTLGSNSDRSTRPRKNAEAEARWQTYDRNLPRWGGDTKTRFPWNQASEVKKRLWKWDVTGVDEFRLLLFFFFPFFFALFFRGKGLRMIFQF